MSNTRLVYSTDPKDQVLCSHCRKLKSECACKVIDAVSADKLIGYFSDRKGRAWGKIVTVLDGLPRNEAFLKDLSKELKNKCGVGGTYKLGAEHGQVEIQGDQRPKIKSILEQKGIRYKGM